MPNFHLWPLILYLRVNRSHTSGQCRLQGEQQWRPAGDEQQSHQDGGQVYQRQRPRHRLIDSVNPFQLAYEIMSKSVDADVLKRIHGAITARRIQMTDEEAVALWPRIKSFNETHGREPSFAAQNPMERRLAEALEWMRAKKREQMRAQQSGYAPCPSRRSTNSGGQRPLLDVRPRRGRRRANSNAFSRPSPRSTNSSTLQAQAGRYRQAFGFRAGIAHEVEWLMNDPGARNRCCPMTGMGYSPSRHSSSRRHSMKSSKMSF